MSLRLTAMTGQISRYCTVKTKLPCSERDPAVAVTVTVEVPAGVPGSCFC